ncbi:MCE family protein [Nocardioides marmoriginsengisoli]|uniref:MCE family protein n=1 Tax=Nocardioides marmoriginsengisoli TaxID=661483 RepID=A0A3N0CG61_9ACTN|nr:MCE family protein [Nocardioides marmoriginsengisoli]
MDRLLPVRLVRREQRAGPGERRGSQLPTRRCAVSRPVALGKRTIVLVAIGLLVVAGIGAKALFGTDPVKITAMFDSTVGLYVGNDVQVLGVPVGEVTGVFVEGESVRVTMEIDPEQPVAADTKAVIIAPTMVSDRFVQLTTPWKKGSGDARLGSGTVLSTERTAVPVEIDDLYRGLEDFSEALGPRGANKNGALSELITTGAENLQGQGAKLNQMIAEFGKASATLSSIDEDFFGTLKNLNDLSDMLVANDDAVAAVNHQFAEVAGFLADDRDEMGEAAENLAAAMTILDDFITENQDHLDQSVRNLLPTVQTLKKQRKSLDTMVRLGPLLLANLKDSYDPVNNLIAGRGNVNEVSLWSNDGLTARTSRNAPPTLLAGTNDRSTR